VTWLVDTLIATGALIALVLVLRRPVARWFGPGMAYALWALPLLRLILPPLVLPARPEPRLVEVTATTVDLVGFPAATATPAFTLPQVALALWLAGALGYLVWRGWGYAAMRRTLLAGARPVGQAGTVRLIETPAAPGPIAFGVFDPVIALPPGFMDLPDRAARDLALAHELAHHTGRDLAVNLAMQPLLALHWFNPLAWLGWRALRRDQEAACDARVLAGRDSATRAAYGTLIAGFATAGQPGLAAPLACPIAVEKSIIHRLRSLTMQDPTPRTRLLGRALIGLGVLALPLTASISYAAQDAPPAVPAAPTAPTAPRIERQVMIIDHRGGATPDDPGLITRTITRDGRTIVFKSSEPLSDAEVEKRVEQALASIPEIPEPPVPPMPPAIPGEGKREVRRVMVINNADTTPGDDLAARTAVFIGDHSTHTAANGSVEVACTGDAQMSNIEAEGGAGEQRQRVHMRFCSKGGTPADQLAALKQARDSMAGSSNLTPELRDKVLGQLDAEIERLSKAG
jgi:bla regulator protein blaR1